MEFKFIDYLIFFSLSDEEIIYLVENDFKLLEQLYINYEGRIKLFIDDFLCYGFDLLGWSRVREFFEEFNECFVFGGNRSGKMIGCVKMVMEVVIEFEGGYIVCFL